VRADLLELRLHARRDRTLDHVLRIEQRARDRDDRLRALGGGDPVGLEAAVLLAEPLVELDHERPERGEHDTIDLGERRLERGVRGAEERVDREQRRGACILQRLVVRAERPGVRLARHHREARAQHGRAQLGRRLGPPRLRAAATVEALFGQRLGRDGARPELDRLGLPERPREGLRRVRRDPRDRPRVQRRRRVRRPARGGEHEQGSDRRGSHGRRTASSIGRCYIADGPTLCPSMPRKSTKRPVSVTAPRELPRARRVAFGSALMRIVLIALLAAGASVWAIWRHFTHPFKSMLVPAPEVEVTYDPASPSTSSQVK
jgi:hypothetical protein